MLSQLAANLHLLAPRDRSFAASLLQTRNPSPKQQFWIAELVKRATTPSPSPVTLCDISGIVTLIDAAHQHLKYPAITLADPADTVTCRVSIAGPAAKLPGSITVTSLHRANPDNRRTWYGRITQQGEFQPAAKLDRSTVAGLAALLTDFAKDPAGIAANYGRLHGHCCFCNLPLSNERSTAVGYGKICAKHYGLPWN